MKSILFVDDEASVLEGLRRMLRPMRHGWDMAFAPGGQEALAMLAERPFDVVVADMRMPTMDGAALLTEIMRGYPDTVRIILSGHSSKESTLKSIGVAHQFLAKPCDADELKQTIDRAFALRGLLSDETLKETLSRMSSVPSMPSLYQKLVEALQQQDASAKRVGEIVAQDPGMTVKVLQLVNSAFFGLPRHIASPEQATALLGVDTMKALVLGIDVFSQFSRAAVEELAPEAVQRHCFETATMAKQIALAEKATRGVADAALTAGFLHDVGKLILAENMPDRYRDTVAHARDERVPLWQAERELLGATHAEVGAYLLGLWGLPDPIVEATAFHHEPGRLCDCSFSAVTAVHAANVFVLGGAGGIEARLSAVLDLDYIHQVGAADRVDAWRVACQGTATAAGGVE